MITINYPGHNLQQSLKMKQAHKKQLQQPNSVKIVWHSNETYFKNPRRNVFFVVQQNKQFERKNLRRIPKMNYVNLIFVLIVQLNLIRQQAATEVKSFRCDTPAKVVEIMKDKVKRMTISQGRVFMIYQHKIISFRIPIEFIAKNNIHYRMSGPILEHQVKEVELNGGNSSERSVGNLVHLDRSETFEIVHLGEDDLRMRKLNFDGDVPGKRGKELAKLKLPFDKHSMFFETAKRSYANLNFLYIFLAGTPKMRNLFLEYAPKTIYVGQIDVVEPMNTQSEGTESLSYNVDYGKLCFQSRVSITSH